MLRPAPARLFFALLPNPITTQAQYEADAISGFLTVTDDGADVATALRRFKERVFGLSVEFNVFLYQAAAETTGALTRWNSARVYAHTGSDRGVRAGVGGEVTDHADAAPHRTSTWPAQARSPARCRRNLHRAGDQLVTAIVAT